MIERRCEPNFPLSLARADADAAAAGHLPLARMVAERMGTAIDAGHGDEDPSATVEAGRA